jgi:pimeloyl-ACP methyl ester carboxylesterase
MKMPDRRRREFALNDELGVPDSARCVVVLHPGAVPCARIIEPLAKRLEGGDVYLGSIDLETHPGFLQSAAPGAASSVTAAEIIHDSIAVLRAEGVSAKPWHLVGWSFGGAIGYGLAAALAPDERPLTHTALDSVAPTHEFTFGEEKMDRFLNGPELRRWFAWYLAVKRNIPFDAGLAAFPGHEPQDVDRGLEAIRRAAMAAGTLSPATEPAGLRKVFDVFADVSRRNNRLIREALPTERNAVPFHLIKATESILDVSSDLGWGALADPVDLRLTPGDHYTMIDQPQTYDHLIDIFASIVPAEAR